MASRIRPRTSSTIPFGYKLHSSNEHLIQEDAQEQDLLAQIRELSESQSLRDLIKFVEAHTGKRLTPRGMQKIINRKY
jgi:hypothetical protein